jgi:hypothetical protein
VLQPQSDALFLILVVIFAGLTWWMVATKHLVFRLLAACLAFLPAMTFGVMAVNKYFGYYQTWGSAISDLTGQGVSAPSRLPQTKLARGQQAATWTGASPTSGRPSRAGTRCGSTSRAGAVTSPGWCTCTCRRSTSGPPTAGTGSR